VHAFLAQMTSEILNEIGRLEAEKNFSAIEIVTFPRITKSIEFFYSYINAIGALGDHYRVIDICEKILESNPELFTNNLDKYVVQSELRYIQSLVYTKQTSKADEVGRGFITALLPDMDVTGEPLLADTCMREKSARSGFSEICSIIGTIAADQKEDQKMALKFFTIAVHVDYKNIGAWNRIANMMSSVDGWKLVDQFKWSSSEVAGEIRAWVIRRFSQHQSIDHPVQGGKSIIPDSAKIACELGQYLKQNRMESAVALIDKFPQESMVYRNVEIACILSVVLLKTRKQSLFGMANYFISHYPNRHESFFVVAVYYLSIGRYDIARNFFSRSTSNAFVDGWIGFGLSFAYSDESGHAINAFRTATRIFPKNPLPWIYMGMEYIRTNELKLAQSYLVSALDLTAGDLVSTALYKRTILNEIGIICLKAEQYDIASENLNLACHEEDDQSEGMAVWFSNLGYAQLKLRDFESAIRSFETALLSVRGGVRSASAPAGALAGLAYCHHCKGNLSRCIDLYNSALSRVANRKIENLLNNLLQLAINEYSFSTSIAPTAAMKDTDMIISAF